MSEIRCDAVQIQGASEKTEEGYIRGLSVATRTGVFEYKNSDGSIRRELRHPDDVFKHESTKTLVMIPMTNGHPPELVNAENASQYSIGQTGESVKIDAPNVLTTFTVTHGDGVHSILDEDRAELSLGYLTDTIEESGTYQGVPYDFRQTNIRYNHLAIVDRARAGRDARINIINMDGAVQTGEASKSTQALDHSEDMNMTKVTLDGIEYDAAPEVAKAMEKLEGSLQAKTDAAEKAEAKLDEAEKALEKLKEERSDEKIREAARARVALERKAVKVLDADADLSEKSDRDVQEAVIKHVHKDLDLSEKSDEYVAARFDAVLDSLPEEDPKAIDRQKAVTTPKADGEKNDVEAKRADALNSIFNQWKRDKSA